MFNNPSHDEIPPGVNLSFSWHSLMLCPLFLLLLCLGEETESHLAAPSCQGLVRSEKVSPEPPFTQLWNSFSSTHIPLALCLSGVNGSLDPGVQPPLLSHTMAGLFSPTSSASNGNAMGFMSKAWLKPRCATGTVLLSCASSLGVEGSEIRCDVPVKFLLECL